ncbi:hypothetical protein ACD661_02825 [Legionella lytica]|uniref:Uncharacterized protein n=1 Tax=Legionella lytica TaxID=96232 RepID=A0ABW8D459_9GAMM
MSVEKSENDLSHWFSTYGVITAERILGRYHINLAQIDLVAAVKSPFSFYHKVLQIPLRNVLNGIVLQQANDYHVYVQKLFIDYLLSGENSKDESSPGASTREALENERQHLLALGEEYHQKEGEHNHLISSSQNFLIKLSADFNKAFDKAITAIAQIAKQMGSNEDKSKIRKAINFALINCDLTNPKLQSDPLLFVVKMNEELKLSLDDDLKRKIIEGISELTDIILQFDEKTRVFHERVVDMTAFANGFRAQFYDTILRVIELIKILPEYKMDPEQDLINRESLYFDKSIGQLDKA